MNSVVKFNAQHILEAKTLQDLKQRITRLLRRRTQQVWGQAARRATGLEVLARPLTPDETTFVLAQAQGVVAALERAVPGIAWLGSGRALKRRPAEVLI